VSTRDSVATPPPTHRRWPRPLLARVWDQVSESSPDDRRAQRSAGPCAAVRPGLVMVTGHDACRKVLTDPRFVVEDESILDARLPGWRSSPACRSFARELLCQNGDEHARRRRLLGSAFSQEALDRAGRTAAERSGQAVAETTAALRRGQEVDVSASLLREVPLAVVAEFAGMPFDLADEAEPRARLLSAFIGSGLHDPDLRRRADEAVESLRRDLGAHLDRPGPAPVGVAGVLLAAERRGEVGRDDVLADLLLMFSAGHETTERLLGSAVAELAADPDLFRRLTGSSSDVERFLREVERLHPPIPVTSRMASDDVELEGVVVVRGTEVLLLLDAANTDPFVGAGDGIDLDGIDLDGRPRRSLSFGSGARTCLGIALARVVTSAVVHALVAEGTAFRSARPGVLHAATTTPREGV